MCPLCVDSAELALKLAKTKDWYEVGPRAQGGVGLALATAARGISDPSAGPVMVAPVLGVAFPLTMAARNQQE